MRVLLLALALFAVCAHAWQHRALQLSVDQFKSSLQQFPNFFVFYYSSARNAEADLGVLDLAIARLFAAHPEAWDKCTVGALDTNSPESAHLIATFEPRIDARVLSTSSFAYFGSAAKTPGLWDMLEKKLDQQRIFTFITKRLSFAPVVVAPVTTLHEQEQLVAHLRSLQTLRPSTDEYHRIHRMARQLYEGESSGTDSLAAVLAWQAKIAADAAWGCGVCILRLLLFLFFFCHMVSCAVRVVSIPLYFALCVLSV